MQKSSAALVFVACLALFVGVVAGDKYVVITTNCTAAYQGNFGLDNMDGICQENGGSNFQGFLFGAPGMGVFGNETNEFYNIAGEPLISDTIEHLLGRSGNCNLFTNNPIFPESGSPFCGNGVWAGLCGFNCKNWTTNSTGVNGRFLQPEGNAIGSIDCSHKSLLLCFAPYNTVFPGKVSGDPHFQGFNGCRYNFGGLDNTVYAIYADVDIQINALLSSLTVEGVDGTWMTKLGFKTSDGSFSFDGSVGLLNEEDMSVHKEGFLSFNTTKVQLKTSVATGAIEEMTLVLSSGVRCTVQVRRFGPSSSDYYLDINMVLTSMPVDVHGILGQTANKANMKGECHPIEGAEDDYIVTDGLLGKAFAFQKFVGGASSGIGDAVPRSVLADPMVANSKWL